jgi:hypothetical protein
MGDQKGSMGCWLADTTSIMPGRWIDSAPVVTPPSSNSVNSVPLIVADNTIHVAVLVGGFGLNMVLDTGATHGSLQTSFAKQLLASGEAVEGPEVTVTLADGSTHSPFESALAANSVKPLWDALAARPDLHVGGAYVIASLNRRDHNDRKLDKREGVLANYAPWFRNDGPMGWRRQFEYWGRDGAATTSASAHSWFLGAGKVGGADQFVAGQFIADLKYREPLSASPDWFTWAVRGPGSGQGLNIVCGRPPEAMWNETAWLRELHRLQGVINPRLEAIGDKPLDGQDTQNVLCDGVWKTYNFIRSGAPAIAKGPLRVSYLPAPDRIPESEADFRVRLASTMQRITPP